MRRRDVVVGALGIAAIVPFAGRAGAATGSGDAALKAMLDGLASLKDGAARLRLVNGFTPGDLSPSAALDLAVVREGLGIDARLEAIMPFGRPTRSPYSVTPTTGAWRAPAADGAPARIAADTTRIRAEGEAGLALPQPLLDRTIAAIDRAAADAPVSIQQALTDQSAELARWRRSPDGAAGVGRWRQGAAWYDLLLDRQFGQRGGGEAAHRRFVAEAGAITARLDRLLARQGYRDGSVASRLRAVFRDPRHLYPDSDAGRDRAVADMNGWLAQAMARVPALIGTVPPECLHVTAARMPPAEEAAGKGGYRVLPRADGAAGRYVVDLKDIRRRPSWSLVSVVHHELLPGHMIQMPIEVRAAPHLLRFDYAPAYQEGWAILAEELMAGDGAGADDPLMQIGHLHWLLFRIARAIVDTGVHLRGWTLREAREKLEGMMGEPAYFASFDQDVERVCLEPAVRAGEALAWLTLRDLHGRAARQPGGGRSFLQAAVRDGRMRRSQLEQRAG